MLNHKNLNNKNTKKKLEESKKKFSPRHHESLYCLNENYVCNLHHK